jgi:hypothetical protein
MVKHPSMDVSNMRNDVLACSTLPDSSSGRVSGSKARTTERYALPKSVARDDQSRLLSPMIT